VNEKARGPAALVRDKRESVTVAAAKVVEKTTIQLVVRTTFVAPTAGELPATVKGTNEQVTATLTIFAPLTVPLPFETTHNCSTGCVLIVTLYAAAVDTAGPIANGPFEAIVKSLPPLSCKVTVP